MASICFMILLGFADDVLDVPWRVKILMPIFASLPLLVGYTGSTAVVIPRPLRGLPLPFLGPLGDFFDLGVLYKARGMQRLLQWAQQWATFSCGTIRRGHDRVTWCRFCLMRE